MKENENLIIQTSRRNSENTLALAFIAFSFTFLIATFSPLHTPETKSQYVRERDNGDN
jgi:hypothetical protein